jgi:hypothetical protein
MKEIIKAILNGKKFGYNSGDGSLYQYDRKADMFRYYELCGFNEELKKGIYGRYEEMTKDDFDIEKLFERLIENDIYLED